MSGHEPRSADRAARLRRSLKRMGFDMVVADTRGRGSVDQGAGEGLK
jgi:hypothetical protein